MRRPDVDSTASGIVRDALLIDDWRFLIAHADFAWIE